MVHVNPFTKKIIMFGDSLRNMNTHCFSPNLTVIFNFLRLIPVQEDDLHGKNCLTGKFDYCVTYT